MRIKTYFKILNFFKPFSLLLIYTLSSSALWSQAEPCGFDTVMQLAIQEDPAYQIKLDEFDQKIIDFPDLSQPLTGQYEIPVVFHIIHDDNDINAPENIADAQIHQAVHLLNEQFADVVGEDDTTIRFTLAKIDPNGNCTNGVVRVGTPNPFGYISDFEASTAMRDLSRWPVENYLNIWVVRCIKLMENDTDCTTFDGFAYRPPFGNPDDYDGVIIRHDRVGTIGTATGGDGTTLPHEIGHAMALLHTWGETGGACGNCEDDSCQASGDMVCDTDPCFDEFFPTDCGVPFFGQCQMAGCNDSGESYPIKNYMSYGNCREHFTAGQMDRMCFTLNEYRTELWSAANALNTGINLLIPVQQDIAITQNTTWDIQNMDADRGAICIDGTVTIQSGARLTVNPGVIVMFGLQSEVIVQPGARLVMNGSTFTACDTWQGIQVHGNTNLHQYTSIQGSVYLTNGATIEHADIGIYTGERIPGIHTPATGTTGGIVQAFNSTFRNNRVDVEFRTYRNINPFSNLEINNASNFGDCESLLTHAYRFPFDNADTQMEGFIKMYGVNGIAIRGHHFEDQRIIVDMNRPSGKIGIESIKSGFNVNERCNNIPPFPPPPTCNGNRTEFVNLGYGIFAGLSTSSSFNISIRNTDFDCWHGIHTLSILDGLAIELNNFNVKRQIIPDNSPAWSVVPSYGIHLDNCIGYTVQENDLVSEFQFGSPASGDETAGIVVRNNHGGGEQIYNNDFHNFNVACEAIAQNRGAVPGPDPGLEFRCNDFTDGRVDIYVSPEVNPNLPQATINGIMPVQNLPANLFSPLHTVLWRHIHRAAGAASITYEHHSPANDARVVPAVVSNGVSTVNNGIVYNENLACPNLLSEHGVNIDDGIIILGDIKDVKNNLVQTTLGMLQTLTDNGNTPLLLAKLNHPRPRRTFRAYVDMIQQAPFTSDEVLEAVSVKETGWNNNMIRNVLRNHPQAAKSAVIQENLDNRTNQLSPFMRNQINQGLTVISEKEQMEIDINTYRRERNLAINQAVQLLASDTIDRTADMIDFFENTGDIQYEYRLAEAYDALGDIEQAENLLTAISNMELTEYETQAHNDYMSFRQLMQTWASENKDLATLSESDLALLQGYTQNANVTAGEAITLLKLNGIDTYREPVYFPDEVETELRIAQYSEEEINEDILLLYPNPADEYLIVEYAIADTSEASLLTVTNIDGQVVYQQKLNYPQDELVIITNKLSAGQYFCTISNKIEAIKTEKFILVK